MQIKARGVQIKAIEGVRGIVQLRKIGVSFENTVEESNDFGRKRWDQKRYFRHREHSII